MAPEIVVRARHREECSALNAIPVDEPNDLLLVRSIHDPVKFAPNHQGGHPDAAPGSGEIESLKLMIERGGSTILGLWFVVPKPSQMGSTTQHLPWRELVKQVGGVKLTQARDGGPNGFWLNSRQREPSAFEVDHVLEPSLRPAIDRDVTCNAGVGSDQRGNTTSIADAHDDDVIGVNASIGAQYCKGPAVALQFGREIGPRTDS